MQERTATSTHNNPVHDGCVFEIVTAGMVVSGRPTLEFLPSVEAEFMSVSVTMPQGTPADATSAAIAKIEAGAARLRRRLLSETGNDYFLHTWASVGDQPTAVRGGGPMGGLSVLASSNVGEVAVELLPTGQRTYSSEQLGLMWRDATGPIPEAVDIDFSMSIMNPGSDIDIQLVAADLNRLRTAAALVKQRLREYAGVYEVSDSFRAGKEQVNRAVNVTASVDPSVTSAGEVIGDLDARVLPEIVDRYPGLSYTFEGAMAEQRDAIAGLLRGSVLALLMMFALLAVPLKSYLQPFIIMSAVPFGLIGAVWGHILLDLNLSMMSLFGLLALTGIVVNDSLIFVDFINRARSEHTEVGRMARGAGGGPADWRRFDSLGLHLAVREAGVIRSVSAFCSRPSSP